ncbi:AMP-dependent synthetase/ligase [Kaarinaea lacus]
MKGYTLDVISVEEAGSLAGLFQERVRRTPDAPAYRYYDAQKSCWESYTWNECAQHIQSIQAALAGEELNTGDRIAILVRNSPQWIFFEQAALGMGLVVVPLYVNDRAESIAYILQNAGVKLLFIEQENILHELDSITSQLKGLLRIVSIRPCSRKIRYSELVNLDDWLQTGNETPVLPEIDLDALATLVYTSGTTGPPKGVMLSHRNILFNANAAINVFQIYREDVMLSFLPLSHMLERTLGYYIPVMCGSTVAFARSVQQLAQDLLSQQPTILISVPRIYDRVYNKIISQLESKSPFAQRLFQNAVETGWQRFQKGGGGGLRWQILNTLVAKKILARLGGKLRLAICGGAPLAPDVAKTFIGLGLNLIQGYGLTETSPIISGNPADDNDPSSVGIPIPGVETRIGNDDELLVRSPSNMMGYWNDIEATNNMIDKDGWLYTGDKVRIENNHIYITGRIKDILVLSNGEKVPPADVEIAITMDPLFEQALVVGEGKPFLSAIVVLEQETWEKEAGKNGFDSENNEVFTSKPVQRFFLNRVKQRLKGFPGYASIKAVTILENPWTIEDGAMTPTMKLKRPVILERHQQDIKRMYDKYKD